MRSLFASVLVVGLAAFGAAAQTTTPADPPSDPATESPQPAKHLAPPEHSKLIGQRIAPPPVTSWPVGEAVTEFKPGTLYVITRYARRLSWSGPFPEDFRHYLGGLQTKFGASVVVVEVIDEDRQHFTIAGNPVESVKDDPDVRTRVGICDSKAFDLWCGHGWRGSHSISAVIDGNGVLVAIVLSHHVLPRILDQLLAGTFSSEEHLRRDDAQWNIQVREPHPTNPAERLAQLEELRALTPGAEPGVSQAEMLLDLDRHDEAVAVIRGVLNRMPVPDRELLKGILGVDDIVRDPLTNLYAYNKPVLEVLLDAAKMLAATSDLKNSKDLLQVVDIARRLRDYETAITYQTMIVALAKKELDQYIETRTLRELEEEAKKR